jgi:hypothetical protein
VGIYNSSLAYSVTAGNFASKGTGFEFNIFNNLVLATGALRDQYRVALSSAGPSVNGLTYNGFTFDLFTTSSNPISLTSDLLPPTPPVIGDFTNNQLRFYFIDPNNTAVGVDYVIGSLASLTFAGYAPAAPSITSVTDNVAPLTGPLTNGAYTNDPDPTVQVSLSGTGALAGDTLQLYNGTGTGSPLGTSYTLTSTDISNGFANVQPGTLTNGTTYTLTARITDAAGNQSAVSTNSFTLTEDTTTPTVAVSIDNTDVNVAHGTGTVTFAFSEAPTSFALADTSAVGGTLSNLQQTDPTHYAATFTGAANTDISTASVNATTMSSVKFSSAVATFYEIQNNWAPSQMIDGIFTGPPPSPGQDATYGGVNGWSVFDFATGMADGADALLTIASPLAAGQHTLTFKLYSNYYGNPGHLLGDFRTCRRSAELGRHFRGVGAFPRATDYEPQSLSS